MILLIGEKMKRCCPLTFLVSSASVLNSAPEFDPSKRTIFTFTWIMSMSRNVRIARIKYLRHGVWLKGKMKIKTR
jgi:hypothetical protein